jgi:hypothetical protein
MHIKYIWKAYRNKATYKWGRGTLRCFETGSHFLAELTKTTGHKYCSLHTSVPNLGNWHGSGSSDPSRKNGSGYIQIFMEFLHKSYLFGGIEMQENSKIYLTLWKMSSQKCRDISRNFVIFRDTKFREIRNQYLAKFHEILPQKNFVDHPSRNL